MLAIDDRRGSDAAPARYNAAYDVLFGGEAPDDKIALAVISIRGAERWSYARLRDAVKALSGQMTASGLRPGDRLLLRLGHTPAFPIAFLAALWAGILPVPTSTQLTDDETSDLAKVLNPTMILADEGVAIPRVNAPVLRTNDLPEAAPTESPVLGAVEREGYMLSTSGTAGQPRLITHSHRAIWARRYMRNGWTDIKGTDRILHAGAFNWSYTLGTGLFDPWSVGATALVLSEGTDIAALPLLAKRHDATIIAAVPGVYRRLLRAPIPPLPKLRHALSAGEKLPETLRERWTTSTGTDIHEAFGQTECSTFISGSPANPAPRGSLGWVQPGRAIAIVEDQTPVDRDTIGEIAVHVDDPGLSLDNRRSDQTWVGTGDMGMMSADGSVTYLGRKDDILTAGGFRISPIEIERAFAGVEGVHEAAAVDHQIDAETTVIALFYTGDAPVDTDVLAREAEKHLAAYKRPRIYKHVTALPVGRNGKLLRRALRTEKDNAS